MRRPEKRVWMQESATTRCAVKTSSSIRHSTSPSLTKALLGLLCHIVLASGILACCAAPDEPILSFQTLARQLVNIWLVSAALIVLLSTAPCLVILWILLATRGRRMLCALLYAGTHALWLNIPVFLICVCLYALEFGLFGNFRFQWLVLFFVEKMPY